MEAGHTLQIDKEQVFVRSFDGNVLTVMRGANGTGATSHAQGAAIDLFEYPPGVTEAAIIQAARLLRLGDGTLSTSPASGAGRAKGGALLDGSAAFLLAGFRRAALGAGVR